MARLQDTGMQDRMGDSVLPRPPACTSLSETQSVSAAREMANTEQRGVKRLEHAG
jgi:hypothetical protein